MRGFLQAHPDGPAAFVHRVDVAKFDLRDDDTRTVSHVTLPSCGYFHHRGWRAGVGTVPSEHFAPWVLRNTGGARGDLAGSLAAAPAWVMQSNEDPAAGLEGSPAVAAAPAPEYVGAPAPAEAEPSQPLVLACPFDTDTLYDASRRCAGYDYNSAAGDLLVPLFEVRSACWRPAHCMPTCLAAWQLGSQDCINDSQQALRLPVPALYLLQIPQDNHVGRVIAKSAAAFRMLRQELARRGHNSLLFRPSPMPAAARAAGPRTAM